MSLLAPVAHSEAEGLQEQVLDVAWILVAKHGCVVSECGLEARVEMACAAESALGRYSGDRFGRVGYPPDSFVQADAVYFLL